MYHMLQIKLNLSEAEMVGRAGVAGAARRRAAGVYGYAKEDLTWTDTDKPGMRLAAVRSSREDGRFLGYLSFESFADTGLHQHLGPAFSYFLQGGLTDFQGTARAGEMGINLEGATHAAIAYAPTLLASRLEAPVIYPSEDSAKGETLHAGARAGRIVNAAPEVLPDINVALETLPWEATVIGGLQRRLIFDYARTPFDRRNVQLRLLPASKLPPFTTTAPLEFFVVGGDLTLSGESQGAGGFFVVEAGARVEMRSDYGCLCLAWSEGSVAWQDLAAPDPFGFAAPAGSD